MNHSTLNVNRLFIKKLMNNLPVALSCGDCKLCGTAVGRAVKPTEPGRRSSNGGDVTGASSPSCPSFVFSNPPDTIGDLIRDTDMLITNYST